GVVSACLCPPHAAQTTTASIAIFTMSSTFREIAGDHQALDLARALVNLGDLRVSEMPLDGEFRHVAIAAEDLDRLARRAVRDVRRVELGHRRFLAVRL